DQLKVTDTVGTRNMAIDCRAYHDSLLTNLKWDNKSQKLNDANIIALTHFESTKSLKINFFSSTQFHLNDSLWTVSPGNFMRIDSNRISFHELVFQSGDASIGLNGLISPRQTDQLTVSMKNFNIAYLNYFTVPKGITLSGMIPSSETELSNLYETPIFTSNTDFKGFFVNGQKLGDGELDASWMQNKQAVYMHGHFSRGIPDPTTGNMIDNILFDGNYYPKNKENSIDINSHFVNIPLDVFTPIMKDYCSLINGQFGGDLHITGTPSRPLLDGKMDVFPRRIKIDYLGLAISGPQQTVKIESNSFFFDDFKVTDGYNDTAKIYGNLFHDNFSKFQFDMDFSFDHFMVLNTNSNQNEDYYGRVFASGYMNVFGYVDDIIRIDMNAKTEKIVRGGQTIYSEFNIPMSTTSEVSSSSDFISFEDHTKPVTVQKSKQLKNNGIELHLNVEATDDAIVKVVFDKTVGDELTAYGNGNIKMDITPSGDFTIFGQYEVDKGNYLFTMKNVILVPFELAKGGVISWNGDPYDAQINADAVYKTTASVEPFFPGDSLNKAYQRSYPTNVVMHLDNNLMNPDVSFDINLPTADQNIQE
ncbi:MAG TPA: translocation/assembly module TamB domain-containing protein, partial [Bacteroidia bacterium]|nr:translocation/assembly module TamB domain-containing protein [Bacteroidia bacterium]